MRIIVKAALAGASILALGVAGIAAAQQTAPAAGQSAATAPIKVAAGATEVMAEMRDKVKLAGNLYVPAGKGPFPCIVQRTPYGKDAMFANPAQMKKYTDDGIAYMVQDVRGKGRSEGFYQAFINDAFDGYDTVEWMAKQPWCNGKIGIMGASAMGYTTMLAATMKPPHLKAAFSIVTPSTRLTGSYIGGAFKQKDSGDWSRGQGIAEDVIQQNAINYPASSYWDRTEIADQRKYINIPVYSLGGWYDIFNEGNVRNFMYLQHEGADGARGNQKLEMGPFGHGNLSGDMEYPQGGSLGGSPNEMRWWDYWLKGVDNGIMKEPPVTYFMMGAGEKGQPASPDVRVLHADNWPPASRKTRFYLTPAKTLTLDAPASAKPQKISYKFDPAHPVPTVGGANLLAPAGPKDQREIPARPDYLRFETAPLDRPVAIAGNVTVELYGATDGLDTDFMAKLVDVYPDGYEAIVLDAPIRTRYRHGFMADQVELMKPNAPDKLTIDLWDTAITFAKGHKIALHISSSSSPKYEINPNTGEAPAFTAKLKPRVATNSIYMDAEHPSALVLPVVDAGGK
ncbi:MAG TPA: CocE/NonD family hydrolase, partial [Hyphomonadaceae bacterium]|nr:CocE/NonD family hydrolase [Hyphomonadaceae bacterium]